MIQISLTALNFELNDKTKELVNEKINLKLSPLLDKFDPEITTATIRLEKEKFGLFQVSFEMNLPGKERVYAKTTHLLLRSALIDLQQQVEKQIKKYKQELSNTSLSS